MAEDEDGRFIFLWIAFNAAYATEIDDNRRLSEQETFKAFLEKLCELDAHKQNEQLVWQEFWAVSAYCWIPRLYCKASGIITAAR